MATAFFKKYPDANPNRFVFKDGKVFFKINPDNENRLADIEYRVFYDSPEWTKYLTSYKDRGFGIWFADGTIQPFDINSDKLAYDIFLHKIYVTNEEDGCFYSDTYHPSIINTLSADYKKNPYLTAILAAYVATYVCGISVKHFKWNDSTPRIITSMARYHLFYHMSRFLRDPSKLDRYMSHIIPYVRKQTPYVETWVHDFYKTDMTLDEWYNWASKRDPKVRNYSYDKESGGVVYQKLDGSRNGHPNDYKRFVAFESNGLTKIGQKLFQQSIQSYIYAVLGAQAKTRWAIIGEGAKSLQTQDVFSTIVKETIAESDVTITFSNMREAIKSTNVVLNMAISPGMILVPSNLIIQKEKIPGYNNVLTLATDKMKFGKNEDINYKAPVSQESPDTPKTSLRATQRTESPKPKPKPPKISVASEILGMTMMVGGFLISKYIF